MEKAHRFHDTIYFNATRMWVGQGLVRVDRDVAERETTQGDVKCHPKTGGKSFQQEAYMIVYLR